MYKDETYHAMTLIDTMYLAIESGYILTQDDIDTLCKARKKALLNLHDDMINASLGIFEADSALSSLYKYVEDKVADISCFKDSKSDVVRGMASNESNSERVVMTPVGNPKHFTTEQIHQAVLNARK